MITCKYCGGENPDDNKFCMHCGAPLDHDAQDAAEQPYAQEDPEAQADLPEPAQTAQDAAPGYDPVPGPSDTFVQPVPIGGLIAWAIFVILGCWIPGVAALYFILKINKAATFEEQQQLLANAKRILIIGTVLSALNLFRMIGSQ